MKLAGLLIRSTILSLAGCSMLPSAGPPTASAVIAPGQDGDQILFDVVQVDDRVVSTLLAQPRESFQVRFDTKAEPPELKIAIGDTISVTIWESAAGGLFSKAPAMSVTGSRPAIEPLAPESRVPAPETPGGSNLPFDQFFSARARQGPGERRQSPAPVPQLVAMESGRLWP